MVIDGTTNVDSHVSLPPEFDWNFYRAEGARSEVWLGADEVDDVIDPDGFGFPGDIVLSFPARESYVEVAVDAITALGVRAIHEGFEWVKVDGQRVAAPHPGDANEEEEAWAFLTNAIREVVQTYRNRYPAP